MVSQTEKNLDLDPNFPLFYLRGIWTQKYIKTESQFNSATKYLAPSLLCGFRDTC